MDSTTSSISACRRRAPTPKDRRARCVAVGPSPVVAVRRRSRGGVKPRARAGAIGLAAKSEVEEVRLEAKRSEVGAERDNETDGEDDENLVCKRICVGAEDGVVLPLDWPENLVFGSGRSAR
ncbi:sodium/calcium exchanger 3 [Striga asiatica]|uniref:Sodium/calcium exchanger 3 n=1 Tax=Striga asiatica TaxID=4170 RepID=A0A5A7P888_STRAF|nr:sodium/calcium exchanger 3 [Striga asiatica]